MTQYIIPCKNISTRKGLHELLAETCQFPSWYGHNLDALHDVLTDIAEDTELIIEDIDALEEHLGKYAVNFKKAIQASAYENEHLTIIYR